MIRLGFICDVFELGGQELGCLEVLRRIDRTRFQPYFYSFRPGSLLPEVRKLDVPVMVGHNKPGFDPVWSDRDEAARRRFRTRLCHRLRADAIGACIIYAWRDGIEAARKAGVRAILERVDGLCLASRIRDKSACQRIICESRTARDVIVAQRQLLQCRRGQIVVIPNGVDLHRFDPSRYERMRCREALGLKASDFVVCAVARLAPEKNLGHLLKAVRHLVAEDSRAAAGGPRGAGGVRAIIAGPDGGCRAELETESRQLGLSEYVRFLGPRSDVPEILRAADAFVLPSLTEGTPFALLEAMAMGLPIVVTQIGSIIETIDGNGYLVGALRPEQTSQALSELRRSQELRCRLGRRSRQLARRYDVDRMMRRYEAVIIDALDEVRSASAARPRTNETEL